MKKQREKWGYLLNGIFWIGFGIILVIYHQMFVSRITNWLGILVFGVGIFRGIQTFLPSQNLIGLKSRILNLFNMFLHLIIGTWVMGFSPSAPILLSKGIGLYQIIIGMVTLVNYLLLRKDRVSGRFHYLLIALVNLIWGVSSLLGSEDVRNTLVRLGIYLIFIGVTSLNDAKDLVISDEETKKLKRRIRIGVPVIFTMLLPARVLKSINQFLNEELNLVPERYQITKVSTVQGEPVLKVLIHVSESGTGTMGHVDLSYKGRIYAYGSYDVDSERLFGSIGDGCFFSLDEKNYIENCLEEGKTLFEYTLMLNIAQQQAFEAKLSEIQAILIPWKLTSETQKASYLGKMSKRYPVEIYKFSKSRFKTYFVLGTNCVKLADKLIGTSGLDLIAMVGILSPGTYYDYFAQEYQKPHSIVVGAKIHNAGIRKKTFSAK